MRPWIYTNIGLIPLGLDVSPLIQTFWLMLVKNILVVTKKLLPIVEFLGHKAQNVLQTFYGTFVWLWNHERIFALALLPWKAVYVLLRSQFQRAVYYTAVTPLLKLFVWQNTWYFFTYDCTRQKACKITMGCRLLFFCFCWSSKFLHWFTLVSSLSMLGCCSLLEQKNRFRP